MTTPPDTWRTDVKVHPAADAFPMMDEAAYAALREDIRVHHQKQPCLLWVDVDDPDRTEWLLDGRNRWRACVELGFEPDCELYRRSAKDAIDMVVSLNVHRRHLTASQKAAASVALEPLYAAAARERMVAGVKDPDPGLDQGAPLGGRAAAQAAKATGASRSYVAQAKALQKADPLAFEKVKRGEVSLSAAAPKRTPTAPAAKVCAAVAELESLDEIQHVYRACREAAYRVPGSSVVGPAMRAHPVTDLFPLLEGHAFDVLVESIGSFGQLDPVWLWNGQIIDGRSRWKACEELGIECQTRTFPGNEKSAIDLALSLNLFRRHLTSDQQTAATIKALSMTNAAADVEDKAPSNVVPFKKASGAK